MNRILALGVGALCAAVAFPSLVRSAGPMQEGNWEVTSKMEIVGMPFAMPPTTRNQCVTAQDVVPDMSQGDRDCVIRDQRITGDTVTWRMECKGKDGVTEGDGRIRYAGKSYDGEINMRMTGAAGKGARAAKAAKGGDTDGTMMMKFTMQGKFTGPCKPDASKAKKAGDY